MKILYSKNALSLGTGFSAPILCRFPETKTALPSILLSWLSAPRLSIFPCPSPVQPRFSLGGFIDTFFGFQRVRIFRSLAVSSNFFVVDGFSSNLSQVFEKISGFGVLHASKIVFRPKSSDFPAGSVKNESIKSTEQNLKT